MLKLMTRWAAELAPCSACASATALLVLLVTPSLSRLRAAESALALAPGRQPEHEYYCSSASASAYY